MTITKNPSLNPSIRKTFPKVFTHSSGALMLLDTPVQPRVTKVAKLIKMCGAYATALYCKNREYSLDEALQLMFGIRERFIVQGQMQLIHNEVWGDKAFKPFG